MNAVLRELRETGQVDEATVNRVYPHIRFHRTRHDILDTWLSRFPRRSQRGIARQPALNQVQAV